LTVSFDFVFPRSSSKTVPKGYLQICLVVFCDVFVIFSKVILIELRESGTKMLLLTYYRNVNIHVNPSGKKNGTGGKIMAINLLKPSGTNRENKNELLAKCENDKMELTEKTLNLASETGISGPDVISSDLWKVKRVFEQVVSAMVKTMEVRDPYTAGHQARVSRICVEIAAAMGFSVSRIKGIELAASIHDIGKLAIPNELLSKPGRLNPAEFEMIKTHSMVGYDIIKDIEFPWPIATMILQHHERANGSGYPYGLNGLDIMLEARILSVADVIEAMSSNRPYRAALGIEIAIEEITKNKNVLYDGNVVDACLRCYKESRLNV
jgi:HD-GYP domain-containing protein (c-di-GMP phosphodiesterase class II)